MVYQKLKLLKHKKEKKVFGHDHHRKKVFISMYQIIAWAMLDSSLSPIIARVLILCHNLFFSSWSCCQVDVVGGIADTSWERSNVGCTGGLGNISTGDSRDSGEAIGQRRESWEMGVGQGRISWEMGIGEGSNSSTSSVGGERKTLGDVKAKSISVGVASINGDSSS